jgi:hypothetical protein
MPTPSAYETGENVNGPHTAGNKYVQSFGGDVLEMEKRSDDYDNFEGRDYDGGHDDHGHSGHDDGGHDDGHDDGHHDDHDGGDYH